MAPKEPKKNPILDDDEDLDAIWGAAPARNVAAPAPLVAGYSSSDESSGEPSETSADRRARIADARLKDHGEEATGPAAPKPVLLPSAAAAFDSVSGPPAFLDPEATRQIPTIVNQGSSGQKLNNKEATETKEKWDISKMAPKLKGDEEIEAGVISAAPKRFKNESGEGIELSAAQLAMLGAGEKKGKATQAMRVEEFLDKGPGVQLPRKRQERKDAERAKRARGQSSHQTWKSEAEMVLRQQYD